MHSLACAPLVLDYRTVQDLLFEAEIPLRRGPQLQAAWDEYARAHPLEPQVVVIEALVDTLRGRPSPFMHTCLGLFSSVLPADLSYHGAGMTIVRGVLVAGVAHADVWSRHLLPFVYRVCGADAAVALLDRVERLGALVAERLGASIGLFSNDEMIADARAAVAGKLAEARATAAQRCDSLHECDTRNYILHHKLLAVQNAAQGVAERHIVGPLLGLPAAALRTTVRAALRSVGAPAPFVDGLAASDARLDYSWAQKEAARLGALLPEDAGDRQRVLVALYQPRWTLARGAECLWGPQTSLAQHRADAELRTHAFLSDVDPTAAYCTGSRSVALGTVSQMMCVVGQVFSDNGMLHNRRGAERVELPERMGHGSVRVMAPAHALNRIDWRTLSDSVATESSGMILRSFTQGLTARSMHIMATTVRSTMANSGNGTRRAGHLARLMSIYGENFSVQVCV